MANERRHKTGGRDVLLERLRELLDASPQGFTYTQTQLAIIAGCNQKYIDQLEQSAKRKLRKSEELKQWA